MLVQILLEWPLCEVPVTSFNAIKMRIASLFIFFFASQAVALEKNLWVLHLTSISPDVIQSVVVQFPKYHYDSQTECEQQLMAYLDRQGFRLEKFAGQLRVLKGELPNLEFRQCNWVYVNTSE